MFTLICVWINGCVNNRKAGDLRRYCAHYGVTVMKYSVWNYNLPFWADGLSLTAWDVATLWFTDDVTVDVDKVDDVKAESPLGELRSWPSLIFIANSARLLASGIRPSGSLQKQNNLLQWRHNGRDGVSNHQPPGCLFKAQIKEITKAPWPLWGEFIDDWWTRCTKGRYRGKSFHLMTSSHFYL